MLTTSWTSVVLTQASFDPFAVEEGTEHGRKIAKRAANKFLRPVR